jgi:hypothetical protein
MDPRGQATQAQLSEDLPTKLGIRSERAAINSGPARSGLRIKSAARRPVVAHSHALLPVLSDGIILPGRLCTKRFGERNHARKLSFALLLLK